MRPSNVTSLKTSMEPKGRNHWDFIDVDFPRKHVLYVDCYYTCGIHHAKKMLRYSQDEHVRVYGQPLLESSKWKSHCDNRAQQANDHDWGVFVAGQIFQSTFGGFTFSNLAETFRCFMGTSLVAGRLPPWTQFVFSSSSYLNRFPN